MRAALLTLLTTFVLSGCGSILATMEVDTIEDDPGERTFGRWIEDNNIETKAVVNIHASNEAFDAAHVNVVAYNGYILLAGQVQTEELKAKATEVLREIKGVRRIYNELEIAAPSSGMTRTSDSWISAKVKSILLADSSIQGNRVKVVTEDGVVYLLGLATAEEADRITAKAADVSGVQRVVRLFEMID